MTNIKKLSEVTINKIAAGEVVERPSSVIKELIENAIDANADYIEIFLENAGKNLIKISDNGYGMTKQDLELAIQRHTTSKLDENDIMNIKNFGFRGEALPAIGAVTRLTIISSQNDHDANKLFTEGGKEITLTKAIHNQGTTIIAQDLFFATPARLKFLRSDKIELLSCKDIIKKIALVNHNIGFKIFSEEKNILTIPKNQTSQDRISTILGEDFKNNSTKIKHIKDNISITGITSLPTYHKSNTEQQFLYINNRPVKDKILLTAVKVAYQDFIENRRHPVICLFITINPREVDVNVHPAKSKVRFRDPYLVRNIIIEAIKNALYTTHNRVSDTLSKELNNILYKNSNNESSSTNIMEDRYKKNYSNNYYSPSYSTYKAIKQETIKNPLPEQNIQIEIKDKEIGNMGSAIHQIDKTYIISETQEGIIITDQHAAHERIVYEELKSDMKKGEIRQQRLLRPEIIELENEKHKILLEEFQNKLKNLGLNIEFIGIKSVLIRELPLVIANTDPKKLINDIVDELIEFEHSNIIEKLEEHILETYACHHSIRAGRKLNIDEMNNLLRQMENTIFAGQCNHGRPTYVKLKVKDIAKLLGR